MNANNPPFPLIALGKALNNWHHEPGRIDSRVARYTMDPYPSVEGQVL